MNCVRSKDAHKQLARTFLSAICLSISIEGLYFLFFSFIKGKPIHASFCEIRRFVESFRVRFSVSDYCYYCFTKIVNCPPGYFFNGTSCQACAVDQYQDREAQTSCITCPSGTSTSGQQASKRLQDCQGDQSLIFCVVVCCSYLIFCLPWFDQTDFDSMDQKFWFDWP